MTKASKAIQQVALELSKLTYDEMICFARGIGQTLGIEGHSPTGMSEDEFTAEDIASSIAEWVRNNLEEKDRSE